MRIIPPTVQTTKNTEISTQQPPQDAQPPTSTQNRTNTSLQAIKTEENTLNNDKTLAINPTSIVNTTNQDKEIVIRDKRAYKAFIKLIKQGKYTSATLSARITGVSRQTISSWLHTKKVQEAMNNEVNQFVSDIKASKDWKAKAYLLDKLEDKDNLKENTLDLKQMIVINT